MKIWQYLETTPEAFRTNYLETRLVDVATHDTFPLQMLTYGREAVHTNNWDAVIRKCRGIIFNIETDEIVARPFVKFFNLGTAGMPETDPVTWDVTDAPEVWEKMDGFLATLYEYNGESYIASKGSFHSTHAKWATAWYAAQGDHVWPVGYTPVFEGICSSLRIVVGYEFEGLVLLALINNETGEELNEYSTHQWAKKNGVRTAGFFQMSWQDARTNSMDPETKNVEGYVLVWRRAGQTPFRLKVKYVDYLKIHRLVTGVSPKRVLEALQNGWNSELKQWTDETVPWFSKFISKWKRALETEYARIETAATKIYKSAKEENRIKVGQRPYANMGEERKAWASTFTRPENLEFSSVLFAMLDGKDFKQVIWKRVKPLVKSSRPMVDANI